MEGDIAMSVYIFIIAILLPDGKMDIKHTFLPQCPDKVQVETFLNEKVKSGEIVKWAGTCSPLKPNATEA